MSSRGLRCNIILYALCVVQDDGAHQRDRHGHHYFCVWRRGGAAARRAPCRCYYGRARVLARGPDTEQRARVGQAGVRAPPTTEGRRALFAFPPTQKSPRQTPPPPPPPSPGNYGNAQRSASGTGGTGFI